MFRFWVDETVGLGFRACPDSETQKSVNRCIPTPCNPGRSHTQKTLTTTLSNSIGFLFSTCCLQGFAETQCPTLCRDANPQLEFQTPKSSMPKSSSENCSFKKKPFHCFALCQDNLTASLPSIGTTCRVCVMRARRATPGDAQDSDSVSTFKMDYGIR